MRLAACCPAALVASAGVFLGCSGDQLVEPEFAGGLVVAAPTNLAAVAISETRIKLTWLDNSSNESSFELYRSVGGEAGPFELRLEPYANYKAYEDWSAQAGTQYCYKIRAVRTTGLKSTYSAFSNTACATTPVPPPPPPPPPPDPAWGLYVIPSTSTAVGVSWSSGTSSNYRIERSLDGGTSWSAVALVSASTYFNDTGLTPDAQVCYRVIAYSTSGEAPPSNTACTAPPAAPTNLVGTLRQDGAVDLGWSDNSTVEDGYLVWIQVIQYNSDCPAGCFDDVYPAVIAELPANSTSYTCYTGCAGWPMFVMATKDGGWSDMSNLVSP